MQPLTQSVASYARRHSLLKPGDRIAAAVSGGADSVALLRILLELRKELGIVLSAAHFNHQLRGAESDADERFVAGLANRHKLELHCDQADVSAHAAGKHLSLEAAARHLRYEFFRRLLRQGTVNRVATAHTLDDQAETVLLRIIRGAGTRGLAGIYPQLLVDGSQFSVIRPLLETRRNDLEAYLREIGQDWREDKSNRDLRYARNRVRHGILPRLERNLNPAVRDALAETAEIARAEEKYWESEIAKILPNPAQSRIKIAMLQNLPLALQRRAVRAVAESVGVRPEFRHVEEVLELISGSGSKLATLPKGWSVSRSNDELRFARAKTKPSGYEYVLCVPGAVEVPESGSRFETVLVPANAAAGYNPEHLLNPNLLRGQLTVRNWRPGDRFEPPHTRAAKKVKELLQQRHVVGVERARWPVVVCGSEVIWLRGFPAPLKLRSQDGASAGVVIREIRISPPADID